MSAGSSIESKSSWFDKYCPKKGKETGDDDDSDGWMATAPVETLQEPSNDLSLPETNLMELESNDGATINSAEWIGSRLSLP